MQCLSNEHLLNFFNQELSQVEYDNVLGHIQSCDKCAIKYQNYQKEIIGIKKYISLLSPPEIDIPEFTRIRPHQTKTIHWYNSRLIRIGIAASIIILFGLLFLQKNNKQDSNLNYSQFENELITTDLNTAWHERQFIINITDEENNTIESYLISKDDSPKKQDSK